ncbi:MAG: hypothetical protein DWQ19_12490 [Crenarchaeota archaeon]|nr:MAG: hypothetical protein DWQ19_12490 [Thermoproteota archaeon]
MIIIKYPFYDFIKARDQNLYDEMARPPVKFKNPKTGEFEGNYNVSSRTPIFTDKYDIYYLYQFPPEFWPAAMTARYNHFLYDALEQGDNYNDIQDVTLTTPGGKGGTAVTFKGRNTFASHLVDKIKRDIDVDFFRKHDKGQENQEKYEKEAEEHKAAGRDLGGYIGASLDEPIKVGQTWAAKGFVPPGPLHDNLKAWRTGSSEGWLEDLDGIEHVEGKMKSLGGRGTGGGQEVVAFAGKDLKRLENEMRQANAVPFKILADNKVAWRNVEKKLKDKEIDFPLFTTATKQRHKLVPAHLPVLFPGKNINTNDIDKYEADKRVLQKFQNIDQEEMELMNYDMDSRIRKLQDEIDKRDLDGSWPDIDSLGKSKKRQEMMTQVQFLQHLDAFRSMLKERNPGRPIDPRLVKEALPEYQEKIQKGMKEVLRNAKKYNAFDYSIHSYNRSRKGHDPLGVGMDNPTMLGEPKYEKLGGGKTAGMGTIWANRQSKHMLHGEEGEWEKKYQDKFGHGYDDISREFRNISQLSPEDQREIEKQTQAYLDKVAQKLSRDSQVMDFLDVSPTDAHNLSDLSFLKARIKNKVPDADFASDGRIRSGEDRVPDLLKTAYNEIRDTNKELRKVASEIESGFTESAIAAGVKSLIGTKLNGQPDVKAAMESRLDMIIMNAENFVRRTIGEAAFRNYEEALRKGAKGPEKRRYIEDLKEFIASKAYNYAGTLAQLKLGSIPSRRLRKGRMKSIDVELQGKEGKGASMASNLSSEYKVDRDVLDALLVAHTSKGKVAKKIDPALFGGQGQGEEEERNIYRTTRRASDEYSGAGHNIEAVYSLLEKAGLKGTAQQKANQAMEKLQDEEGQVSSQEAEMVSGISASVALFNLFKQMAQRNAERQGKKINEKEANSEARKRLIDYLKTNRYLPSDYSEPQGSSSSADYAKDFRRRVGDEAELDAEETQAAQVINKWNDAGLNKNQINLELNKMTLLKNIGSADKRVIDLLLIYYGRKPEMGTFDDQPALAASALSSVVPDIDEKISQEKRRKLAKMAFKGVPGAQPSNVAPQQPAQPEAMPTQPARPMPQPKTQQTAVPAKPGSSPLANRIKRR